MSLGCFLVFVFSFPPFGVCRGRNLSVDEKVGQRMDGNGSPCGSLPLDMIRCYMKQLENSACASSWLLPEVDVL